MAEDKWVRIMEMVFGLVNEIDEALNEVDAQPIETIGEDDHSTVNDFDESEEFDTTLEILDVCINCGVCTSDLKYHLKHNVDCRQALRYA